MRPAAILLLASLSLAEEDVDATLQLFAEAREATFAPGAEARLAPLIERLGAARDARVVRALGEFIATTLLGEQANLEKATGIEGQRAGAVERMKQLDRELAHLRARERSGANVGPDVARCMEEHARRMRSVDDLEEQRARVLRLVEAGRKLREQAVGACADVLGRLEGEAADGAMAELREILGVADRVRALLLVQILRESRNPCAAGPLLDVMRQAQEGPAVRDAATALALVGDAAAVAALLDVAERDEPLGIRTQLLHALGIRARKRLESVEKAREWAATLEG